MRNKLQLKNISAEDILVEEHTYISADEYLVQEHHSWGMFQLENTSANEYFGYWTSQLRNSSVKKLRSWGYFNWETSQLRIFQSVTSQLRNNKSVGTYPRRDISVEKHLSSGIFYLWNISAEKYSVWETAQLRKISAKIFAEKCFR